MTLAADDRQALMDAVRVLENPGLVVQLANTIGWPIEYGVNKLPRSISHRIDDATHAALRTALRVAVSTMSSQRTGQPWNATHKLLATLSGAAGGAFGLPALAIELPVSTTIMLRGIADIARGEGEDIRAVDTQLACIEVFALGSRAEADNSTDTGYYATRAALAHTLTEAASFIAQRGLVEEGAPAIVRLITRIAGRFSVSVTEKFLVQSIPAIGAAGGGFVNLIFINHFQDMARGHFVVRRLERTYGQQVIRHEYDRIHRQGTPQENADT